MAFTVTFPTNGPLPSALDIAAWLTEHGEPFEQEGSVLSLRALPVRVVVAPDQGALSAWLEVTPQASLVRLVDLLFDLSVRAGADVRLAGAGEMTRARLWLRLADEQDRMRIAEALVRAEARGNATEVVQRLWSVLAVVHPGRDLRWDAANKRVVELVEVGPTGISEEDAGWLVEGAQLGDVVPRAVEGVLHMLAWRYLSEAYPGLAEP